MRTAAFRILLACMVVITAGRTSSLAVAADEAAFSEVRARIESAQGRITTLEKQLAGAPTGENQHARVRLNVLRYSFQVGLKACSGNGKPGLRSLKVAESVAAYLEPACARVQEELARASTGPFSLPDTSQPLHMSRGAFHTEERVPVLFIGPLWGWNLRAAPNLSDFGMNLNGVEVGPSAFLTSATEVNVRSDPVRHLLEGVFPAAERGKERVDLLLSPHYVPDWFLRDHPELTARCGLGAAHYCLESAETRNMLERYLRAAIPLFREKQSLLTYDLFNEFLYEGYCQDSMREFHRWLVRKHGTIARLNQIWQTRFRSFDEIPAPFQARGHAEDMQAITGAYDPVGIYTQRPPYYDWCRFNQWRCTEFLKWMRGLLREMDHQTPVTVKTPHVGIFTRCERLAFIRGVDREAIAQALDVTGLDAGYSVGNNYFDALLVYDYLRSVAPDKRIFNTENHFIFFAEDMARQWPRALWQQFLHGQVATDLFMWGITPEWFNPALEAGGAFNFAERPEVLEALAVTSVDVQRLSREVLAFQDLTPEFAFLFPLPSLLDEQERFQKGMLHAYRAALFLDTPVGFVSDRQAKRGIPHGVKLLVVPGAPFVEASTVTALQEFVQRGGRLVLMGDECLRFDEYGRPRTKASLDKIARTRNTVSVPAQPLQETWLLLDRQLSLAGVSRRVRVTTLDGAPAFRIEPGLSPLTVGGNFGFTCENIAAVEARTATLGGRRLVYLINPTPFPQTIRLRGIRDQHAEDLIARQRVSLDALSLASQQVKLLRLQ
ncbi:MAG: beta-galactosidase [Armatimonadetes bacterium]|nr:beta-galactosidase [Armatimonadota bacterium]